MTKIYWIIGGVATVVIAAFIGYEWGNASSVVAVVEQHLAASEAQVRRLELRVQALEAKLGVEAAAEGKTTAQLQ